ncbi:MAG: hypothetical protein DMF30_09170 [Verrucomicrobia bacterium]|nr:MAG: hypothetical protein DMF30_09170 [Verrucomicrobiota bacterium]
MGVLHPSGVWTYTAFRRSGQHRPLREQDRHDQRENRVAVHVSRKVNDDDTRHAPTPASRKWSKFFSCAAYKMQLSLLECV